MHSLTLLYSLYINTLVEKLKVAGIGVECRRRLHGDSTVLSPCCIPCT